MFLILGFPNNGQYIHDDRGRYIPDNRGKYHHQPGPDGPPAPPYIHTPDKFGPDGGKLS